MNTTRELYNILIKHIEDNKAKYDIDYMESIKHLQELIDYIKQEYEELTK